MHEKKHDLFIGGIAGLFAGMFVGILVQSQHIPMSGLNDPGRQDSGFILFLVFAVIIGALFSAGTHFKRGLIAPLFSGGILTGFIWWIVGSLSLIPWLSGASPNWSLKDISDGFPALVGFLMFGGLTGLGFYGLRYLFDRLIPVTSNLSSIPKKRIIIVGAGFGGVYTARRLEQLFKDASDVEITLIGQNNFLLFTPMLAEVASNGLQAQHISAPVRAALKSTKFIRAYVSRIDTSENKISYNRNPFARSQTIEYDHLVLALGSVPNYFGMPGLQKHAFSLKSLGDAIRLRNHVLTMLERADSEEDPQEQKRLLTFFVAGGGFAGTEMIAELFDLVHSVLRYYPHVDRKKLRFILVHSRAVILPEISEKLARYAMKTLTERGIEFLLEKRVSAMAHGQVFLNDGDVIETYTPIWTAGNRPHPVLKDIPAQSDPSGALKVNTFLQISGTGNIWALGDCARIPDPFNPGAFYPPTAQHAMREGRTLAENIHAVIRSGTLKPFRFKMIGMLVGLGHRTAAAEIRGIPFSGFLAWFMWRTIYLNKLPGFEKKLRVMIDWTIDLFFPRDIVLTDQSNESNPLKETEDKPTQTVREVLNG